MLWLEVKRRARVMLGPLIGACIAFYFGWHAVHGPRGINAVVQLDRQIAEARSVLREEDAQRNALEARVSKLRPDYLDTDVLEERARFLLNYGRPDDVVIFDVRTGNAGRKPARVTDPRP